MSKITRRHTLKCGAAMVAGSLLGCATTSPRKNVRIFDVRDYGAVGDGKTLDTAAIQKAINEASAAGPDAMVLLRGGKTYLVGSIALKGGIDFHLADDAKILVSTNPDDYTIVALPRVAASQPTTQPRNDRGVFSAKDAHNLRVTGTGTIDGRWREFMDRFDDEQEWWRPKPFRPPLFQFVGCRDLTITDINIIGSPVWTVHLLGCRHALVDRIMIKNQLDVPNCDGVNPDHSQDVEIRNCRIACGDDSIAVKCSRYGMEYGPTERIRVHDCILETQDSGLKLGTETVQDIRDIHFSRCNIRTACRGLTIQLRDQGNVENVRFEDIRFVSRYHSFPWWGRGEAISFTAIPRNPETKLGTIRNVVVKNVSGRAENSVRVNGSPQSRVRDVAFENVALTFDRWTKYKGGEFDNRPTTVVDQIETHANPGFHLRHAENVTLKRCRVAWGRNRPDYFTHALQAENVTGLEMTDFEGDSAHPERISAISVS